MRLQKLHWSDTPTFKGRHAHLHRVVVGLVQGKWIFAGDISDDCHNVHGVCVIRPQVKVHVLPVHPAGLGDCPWFREEPARVLFLVLDHNG